MKPITPEKESKVKGFIKSLATFALMIFFFNMFFCSDDPDESKPATRRTPEQIERAEAREALIISRRYVEKNLNDPSSAEFTSDFKHKKISENYFLVASTVTAKNAFGGKITLNYVARIKLTNQTHVGICDSLSIY